MIHWCKQKSVFFSCVWYSADNTRETNSIQWNWNEFRVQQSPSYVNAMMHMSKERWVFSKISLKDDKNDCQKAKTHHTDPTFEFEVIHFHLGNSLKMDIFLLFPPPNLLHLKKSLWELLKVGGWNCNFLHIFLPTKKLKHCSPYASKKEVQI